MKQELRDKEVIVMYDIRNIQNYIFRTNKVRDIIGASALVDNLLERGLKECGKKHPEIPMEQLFIGGGNACVRFERGEDAQVMNRALARWVQDKTYSLQLAVAAVEKTGSYSEDYDRLQREMARVKQQMTETSLMGAFPVMQREPATGLALTSEADGPGGKECVSKETFLKREALKHLTDREHTQFDEMVEEKGVDSTLAVVHMDGNSMGRRLKQLMEYEQDYDSAIRKMKTISHNINDSFQEAFDAMCQGLPDRRLVRKIILAGDDITFVCTAKYALALVCRFVEKLKRRVLLEEGTDPVSNLEKNGFSICAGIAYMHSHFPFSEAYRIAELCCENAKERAKSESARVGDTIGNWVDFQICKDIQTTRLKESRQKNYRLTDGHYLLLRPYYIPYKIKESAIYEEMDRRNAGASIESFQEKMKILSNKDTPMPSHMVHSDLKELRNTYPLGEEEMEALLAFYRSRGKTLPEKAFDKEGTAIWYDALEMYELYAELPDGVQENSRKGEKTCGIY